MKNELISIIIVNYNGLKWLKKCFDSVLAQTYTNFELIIVDNFSSDGSIDFIESNYNDKRIKIIKSEKNLGFAGGNNLGIKMSQGEYILLLNSDTWIDLYFLEKIYNFYQEYDFDVVAPYERGYNSRDDFIKYVTKIDFLGHPIYLRNQNDNNFYLSGVCVFLRKDIYFDTKGLDSNFFMYFEETDWFWRLNLMNKKFCYIDDLFVYHAGAGSTGGGIKYLPFLWRNQNELQMILKNYKWYNLLWVLPCYLLQNFIEIIFFLLIMKPRIAFSYIEGWYFIVMNMNVIFLERKWIQGRRIKSDFRILQSMYIGSAKFKHLLFYYYDTFFKKNI